MIYDLTIVGAGVAGLIALGMLPESTKAWNICVVDPTFSGGDLATKWGPVSSNTTAKQVRDALKRVPRFTIPSKLNIDKFADTESVLLYIVATDVQNVASEILSMTDCITDAVTSIEQSGDDWDIIFRHQHSSIKTKRIFLCPGGEPRSLDIARPTISLDVAFDAARLPRYVSASDTVTIFGASHSGVLIAHNLHTIGARVFLVHKRGNNEQPFSFARDGAYEGVKASAAIICDDILANKYPKLTLVSYSDGGAVANAVIRSKFVVYAIGFGPRLGIQIAGKEKRSYNPQTGEIEGVKNIWGFGAAYPNSSEYKGQTYYDIGIPAFVEHIGKCVTVASRN